MKTGIIYPPLSFPISPYMSMTLLAGQLKQSGFDVNCIDLNAEFYSDICKKDILKKSLKKSENIIKEYTKSSSEAFDNLEREEKVNQIKYLYVKSELIKNKKTYSSIAKNISSDLKILKSKKDFYNPEKFKQALEGVKNAVNLFFLPYTPAVSKAINLKKQIFKFNYEDIKYQTVSKLINPYIEYFREKTQKGFFSRYSLLFITVSFAEQLLPALTLARILKKYTNIKIVIGGNYITRIKDGFIKNPEIFDLYLDGLICCDGEESVIEYAKYHKGKLNISEVSNLIYKNSDNQIVQNETKIYTDIENRALQCFDGIDFKKYFAPEIEISIQTSKGCYWNRCSFCDYSFGKPFYASYSPDKLINELKYYKNKFGVTLFEITDEALRPDFFEKVADKIIEENLKVNLYCFFRLEHNLTPELMNKFKRAGVKAIQWGYEAASERIMKLMNKGIDVENRLNILRYSSDAGIWNRVFAIACFPTETEEELLQTIDVIKTNRDIFHSFIIYKFVLGKHCYISKNLTNFNINITEEEEDFSAINQTFAENYTDRVRQKYSELIRNEKNIFRLDVHPDEYLLYYLSHYSKSDLIGMYKNN